jgi:hypothetical protein
MSDPSVPISDTGSTPVSSISQQLTTSQKLPAFSHALGADPAQFLKVLRSVGEFDDKVPVFVHRNPALLAKAV